jgi:hypothetical protein
MDIVTDGSNAYAATILRGAFFSLNVNISKIGSDGVYIWNSTIKDLNLGGIATYSLSVYVWGASQGKYILVKLDSNGHQKWRHTWGKGDPENYPIWAISIAVNDSGIYLIKRDFLALSLMNVKDI